MRRTPRRAIPGRTSFRLFAALAAAVVTAVVLAVPADVGDASVPDRLDPAYRVPGTSSSGMAFGGLAAVGALLATGQEGSARTSAPPASCTAPAATWPSPPRTA